MTIQVSPDQLPKDRCRFVAALAKDTQVTTKINNSKLTKSRHILLDPLQWRWLIIISAVLILSDQRKNGATLPDI